MEDEHGLVAWGGVQMTAPRLAVMWSADRAGDYPVGLGRIGLHIRKLIERMDADVYAIQDADKPTAPKFLAWLGFEPCGQINDGRVLHKWTTG